MNWTFLAVALAGLALVGCVGEPAAPEAKARTVEVAPAAAEVVEDAPTVVLTSTGRDALIERCQMDGENAEACACSADAAKANALPATYDAMVAGAVSGERFNLAINSESTPEQKAEAEALMMASFDCMDVSNLGIMIAACEAQGRSRGTCFCEADAYQAALSPDLFSRVAAANKVPGSDTPVEGLTEADEQAVIAATFGPVAACDTPVATDGDDTEMGDDAEASGEAETSQE